MARSGGPAPAFAPGSTDRSSGARPSLIELAATVTLGVALVTSLATCRSQPRSAFEARFRRVATLQVSPIEPFNKPPGSLLVLPDGRLLLAETDGVWIHVTDAEGQGLTRLGGERTSNESGPIPGRFKALTDLALLPDGRVLAADASSSWVTEYSRSLEPEDVLEVPRSRGVYCIEPLPDGRLAAAVAPRNAVTGGQIVVFSPGDSGSAFLPPNPLFRDNRWQPVSSSHLSVTRDGWILAYWAPLPWAEVLSPAGDSLGRIGRFSSFIKGPPSGPGGRPDVESLRRWYDRFSPLAIVESVGDMLIFEYRAPADTTAKRHASRSGPPAEARGPMPKPGQMFVNLYDARGRPIAADVLLPEGTRLLRSNDRSRLYLAARASPREMEIQVWEPRATAMPEGRSS